MVVTCIASLENGFLYLLTNRIVIVCTTQKEQLPIPATWECALAKNSFLAVKSCVCVCGLKGFKSITIGSIYV